MVVREVDSQVAFSRRTPTSCISSMALQQVRHSSHPSSHFQYHHCNRSDTRHIPPVISNIITATGQTLVTSLQSFPISSLQQVRHSSHPSSHFQYHHCNRSDTRHIPPVISNIITATGQTLVTSLQSFPISSLQQVRHSSHPSSHFQYHHCNRSDTRHIPPVISNIITATGQTLVTSLQSFPISSLQQVRHSSHPSSHFQYHHCNRSDTRHIPPVISNIITATGQTLVTSLQSFPISSLQQVRHSSHPSSHFQYHHCNRSDTRHIPPVISNIITATGQTLVTSLQSFPISSLQQVRHSSHPSSHFQYHHCNRSDTRHIPPVISNIITATGQTLVTSLQSFPISSLQQVRHSSHPSSHFQYHHCNRSDTRHIPPVISNIITATGQTLVTPSSHIPPVISNISSLQQVRHSSHPSSHFQYHHCRSDTRHIPPVISNIITATGQTLITSLQSFPILSSLQQVSTSSHPSSHFQSLQSSSLQQVRHSSNIIPPVISNHCSIITPSSHFQYHHCSTHHIPPVISNHPILSSLQHSSHPVISNSIITAALITSLQSFPSSLQHSSHPSSHFQFYHHCSTHRIPVISNSIITAALITSLQSFPILSSLQHSSHPSSHFQFYHHCSTHHIPPVISNSIITATVAATHHTLPISPIL